jgi:cytochrome c peroxidase
MRLVARVGRCNCGTIVARMQGGVPRRSLARRKGLINEDGGDQGFHVIGVRPTAEDLGRKGLGPAGVSFSVSGANADRGAFKTAALRNVKLTAPYFHSGGKATLTEVV